jgi:hypothetical protein
MMNKLDAKKISESGITVGQIRAMLIKAYDAGEVNETASKINKGFSKAAVYNIYLKSYEKLGDKKEIKGLECLGAKNALYDFGEYWDGWRPEKKIKKHFSGKIYHEAPLNPRD